MKPAFDKEILKVFIKLVENLSDKLSTYDTILSDDTSGRLTSLVLRKVINEARKRKGLDSIDTYFLASGRHKRIEVVQKIKDFLENKKSKISKPVTTFKGISTKELNKENCEELLNEVEQRRKNQARRR